MKFTKIRKRFNQSFFMGLVTMTIVSPLIGIPNGVVQANPVNLQGISEGMQEVIEIKADYDVHTKMDFFSNGAILNDSYFESILIHNEMGYEVEISLPFYLLEEISKTTLLNIANESNEKITIYGIELIEHEDEEVWIEKKIDDSPIGRILGVGTLTPNPAIYRTTVNRRPASFSNTFGTSQRVLTVARQMSTTLSSTWTRTTTVSLNTGTGNQSPWQRSGGLAHSVTATRTRTHVFNGPSENSHYRSTDFRQQFEYEPIEWTQTRSQTTGIVTNTQTRSGTGVRPHSIIWYSVGIR
ncbi:MAG: hypothetical protein FWF59_14365 [Turicibacter sp.]|nr:hypothetical protein [Turicibacter sp.]